MESAPDLSNTQEPITDLLKLGFAPEALTALGPAIAATRQVTYTSGEALYHEASLIEALYVVRSGRIKLLSYLDNGRARIVRLHNSGSVIGLNGLMEEQHAHTAMAIDDVVVYQIPMPLIRRVKEEDPDAYCKLLEYWHEYLHTADTWITEFSTGAIRGRVARLIRFLVEQDEQTGPSEVTLLTVEEMSEILGVTPESVSRVMAEFKRSKILIPTDNDNPTQYRCAMQGLLQEAEH